MTTSHTTLIEATELVQHCDDPDWVILDCRHDLSNPNQGRRLYSDNHIPGAQFAHLDFDLSGSKISAIGAFCGRHPLPDRELFVARMRAWGINNNTQIVAYDAQGGMFAARLWWLARWLGISSVAVLDGGYPAWRAAGLPVSTGVPAARRGTLQEQASLVSVATTSEVQANLLTGTMVVVDARSPDRFRGENETLDPIGGHIPGAKNRFFKDNLLPDGGFKSHEQLHSEWQRVLTDPQTAIMQCGSGVTACHNLLALEVAGLPGAALYAGSWSEWCMDPRRPVALGPEA